MSPRAMVVFGLIEPGGILIFPFTFFFSDIITEVYGYKQSRRLIWVTVICLLFFVVTSWLCMRLPSSSIEQNNYSFVIVFDKYPKALLGIGSAIILSFLTNNLILAKLKILSHGRYYWVRSILSTSIGHAIFSLTWSVIFYFDVVSFGEMLRLAFNIYGLKIVSELVLTPFSTFIAESLKKREGVDVYDYDTKFNFFSLKVDD